MSKHTSQEWFISSGATLQLPPRMRLARDERERLWRGLERFVNCGDTVDDFHSLGTAFPDFWPIDIQHFPNQETTELLASPVLGAQMASPLFADDRKRTMFGWELTQKMQGMSDQELEQLNRTENLNWHSVCHRLFLLYRNMLRTVWRGANRATGWLVGGEPEFLLGVSDWNERAHEDGQKQNMLFPLSYPHELCGAWEEILREFPTAWPESPRKFRLIWDRGDLELVPGNDFQRAFFLLFRESWRARLCPRCGINKFFIASRSKQMFCGTVCSAGSRLASKRKWWNRVGTKQRAAQDQSRRKRNRNRKERQSR